MKQLRVLTGRHAGAQLRLTSSTYRISADTEADIQIADWTSETLVLNLQEDDVISIAFEPQMDPASPPQRWFEDLVPQRFGEVVLCTGPADQEWPSDLTLLQRLMQPVVAKVAAPAKRRGTLATACGLLALAVGATFITVVTRSTRAAQAKVVPEPLVGQVWRVVAPLALKDIVVSPSGSRVVVQGLVDSTADVSALRRALASFAPDQIMHRYAAVPDIAQSITDALPASGLSVTYQGQGRFTVGGKTVHLEKVREAAARIATDLAPVVQHIDLATTELPKPDSMPMDAMLSTDGLQYVQTRDGAKHLSLSPQPIVELPDSTTDISR